MSAGFAAPALARPRLAFAWFIAGLSVIQILSWGSTFYLPSVLERAIAAETGLSREILFGGVSVMLAVSALIAPAAGRHLDAHGSGRVMLVGIGLLAVGLALVGVSHGWQSYLAGWVLFGLAMPLAMSVAAFTAIAQTYPERGRSGIITLMLFSGAANGVMWPLIGWLDNALGWRATCLALAAAHLVIALPIALAMRPARPSGPCAPDEPANAASAKPAAIAILKPEQRRAGFWWLVMGSGVSGFVTWGLPLFFIPIFVDVGLSTTTAIIVASILGYATSAARLIDLGIAGRFGGLRLVSGGSLISPVVFVLLLAATLLLAPGPAQTALIALAMVFYGIAAGLISAARATLPLELFGPAGFATTLGNLSFWLNLIFATSPLAFAALHDGAGATITLLVALAGSLVAALAFWRLEALARRATRSGVA